MKKRVGAFLLALCMCIAALPIIPVNAATNQRMTGYLDLKDQVYQAGGYYDAAASSDTMVLSLSQEERRAVLAEKLVAAWSSYAASCDVSGYGITLEDLQTVYAEQLNENYRFFYVNSYCSYSYTSEEIITVYISYNMSETEAMEKVAVLESAVSQALHGADPSWSDMEKALYINDYLARSCEYDTTYTRYTAYDALVDKTAVCQGYALAYQLLARELGLVCEMVTSNSLNHAWNLVKIGDHSYHVDVTWNDPLADRLGRARHEYFMKSSAYFSSDAGGHAANDWVIGSGLTPDVADNTDYDSYFWDDISTGFEYVDGNWYGIQGSAIYQYSCDGNQFTGISEVKSIDATWMVWGSTTSHWIGSYASLASYDGLLYYSLPDAIYQLNPSTGESSVWYSLSEEQKSVGYIYGMRIWTDGEVEFLLATSPNQSGTVGIYTAGRIAKAPISVSSCVISLETSSYTYDGTAKTPTVTVADESTVLVSGIDYTVSYSNNTNAGTATVTITGIGAYTGSITKNFTITKADQTVTASVNESEIVTGSTTTITATGIGTITYTSDNTDVATVDVNGIVTGISAGTAVITVTAEGNNNYNAGSATVTVTVKEPEPTSIAACTVTLDTTSYTYDGTAKTPSVTVKDGTQELTAGADYTVSYSSNTNAGVATVTITGMGAYTGSVTKNFTIVKADQTVTASVNESEIVTGSTTAITVAGIGTITYSSDNTNVATVNSSGIVTGVSVGTAVITVTAEGNSNYNSATATITVTVKEPEPTSIAVCTITLGTISYTYDGTAKTPSVTVKDGTQELTAGADYTVSYSSNTNAGTATVTITGIGDYIGMVTETFTIEKAEAQELNLSSTSYTYDGKEKKPSVTVKDAVGNVISSDNYTVTYSNNTNAGTAKVTVTMKGNYTGTLTKDFTIKKASQTLTAKIAASSLIYGKTNQITASGTGKITYSSSNTSVVMVSSSGVVTAKGAGTATITVKAAGDTNYNSETKTIKVTVQYATPSISSVSNTSGGVQIKWTKVSGAAKYRVYRKTGGGSWAKVGDTTGTSYTDKTAKSGTTYAYTVRCISSDGKSTTSGYNTTGKTIVRLSQPAPALSNTTSGVKISWSKVTGASGYYVYRKSGSGSWKKIKITSSTSYTDTGAKNGTTYYYTVKAYKGSSASSYVTTKKIARLSTPSISSATNSSSKKMTVKWAKNASATGYEIKYVTGSTTKTVTVSGASTVSKVISGLTKGKTYKVYVRSYKTVSGTKHYSAWSSAKSVKITK